MGKDERLARQAREAGKHTVIALVNNQLGEPQEFEDSPRCEKCGGGPNPADMAHCPGFNPIHPDSDRMLCRQEGEHLHVRCARCGYEWRMWCVAGPPSRLV